MNTMQLDGYVATIELDEAEGFFHGEIINTRDVLTFQGRTIPELRKAFAETLADYRDWCAKRGKAPEKPFSGALSLRLGPELHRRVAAAAARDGLATNAFIKRALEGAA